ncbi:MAG TPA: amino acid adenylation domain-containing protein, partial [Thermoanaerobaculia bacterium]|nr:amino acid adenylation domain-containing protein [Thermoanaerobaculia bacterium]
RTWIEEVLAGIWSDVLGVERVGTEDDFFALGGHSLLVTRVVSRLRGAFGIELPLRTLFEAPTLAGLAGRVELALGAEPGVAAPPLVPVPRGGALPLSFAQQRLWFLDQLEPGSAAYNLPSAVRLTGELSPALLARVFTEIVRRHESLRTTFTARQDGPVQEIAPPGPVELPVIDLSGLAGAAREAEARRQAGEEARRPFDLQRGPLLRLRLLRLAPDEHALLMTMHHIVSDGWSAGVLLGEIATLHTAFAAGRPSPLPELPIQYADFAAWQRGWLRGEVLEAQAAAWTQRLAGAPRVLELPLDRPRPAVQAHRGSSLAVSLPPELSAAVRELCRREGATPFMALLAGWAALLGRHAGQDDVLVGTPIAGRNRREVEGLIGFFVNTLVLRTGLSGEPGFGELLARVRQACLEAYTHQDLPFERLVEELVPGRDLSVSPLFQVMLVLQSETPRLSVPGLELSPLPAEGRVAKFDLTLALEETAGVFAGALEYDRDLFDRSTVARLSARFAAFLEGALAAPDAGLAELPLLLPGERHQVLREWNDSATSYAEGRCLHELIAARAAATPDAVAAVFEDEALTCHELARRAHRLARHLAGLGVRPDGRVGVLMERSLEMIVGLAGVLAAGAAYVPLDPSYPAARLAVLLESAGVDVVLAQSRLAPLLPRRGERGEKVVALDGPPSREAAGSPGRAGEDNLAYVIYTSGSTGTPKGVMIPHRGIVNRLLWMRQTYGLAPADRVLQKTPFSFDVSVWELFCPLITGSRLVLARPEGHKEPAYLADLIAREGITTLHFVPSMLQAFLEVPGLEALGSLRRVMASGEALPPDLVRRFFRRLGGVELHNLYGPTEASVEVSAWAGEPEPPRGVVPIGRPIANLRLHVVDRGLRPQPVGVAGELLLGGVGLARGYLGRPELTAAAFVPDPLGGGPGERLYRTGDLARTLPDGQVEYLGRIDHQVKIRGVRIELGEVEAVLGSHPAVRECVVAARGEGAGSPRLVAYIVASSGTDPVALRAFLAAKLPEAMVPAAFVILDA